MTKKTLLKRFLRARRKNTAALIRYSTKLAYSTAIVYVTYSALLKALPL